TPPSSPAATTAPGPGRITATIPGPTRSRGCRTSTTRRPRSSPAARELIAAGRRHGRAIGGDARAWRRPPRSGMRRGPLLMPPAPRRPPPLAPLPLTTPGPPATPNPNAAKFPPRGLNCKVLVFRDAPGVKEWDDLGMAHVDCPLDVGAVQCLKKLRS